MTPPINRSIRTLSLALGVALLPSAVEPSHAGNFDCAVVYDEFESLMNKRFLMKPSDFVQTLPGRMSRQQFEGVASAGFNLYPTREGMGVGILNSNQNIHAKFLFHWSQPMADGDVHVIIDEIIKYGRVADGYAPNRLGPFRLKPGMALDFDSASYVPREGELAGGDPDGSKRESGDLKYEAGAGEPLLRAVNGAEVEFPLESMCRQESS